MAALAPLERRLRSADLETHGPPIFVLGPPRSGTTLLYDVMAARFRFAYLSNAANRLWRTPAAATFVARRAIRNYRGVFESRYGHISAWGAPNEGGAVWRSWYDETIPLDERDHPRADPNVIRDTIGAVSHILEAPFLSKNVMHSMHVRFLDMLFPGCLFIEVRRDDLDTAKSILRLRAEESRGDLSTWRSIRPPGHEPFLSATPATQVCAQILLTRQRIESDVARVGERRRWVVHYERLCRDPLGVMEDLRSFVKEGGGGLVARDTPLPEFSARSSRSEQSETDRELAAEFARLEETLSASEGRP